MLTDQHSGFAGMSGAVAVLVIVAALIALGMFFFLRSQK